MSSFGFGGFQITPIKFDIQFERRLEDSTPVTQHKPVLQVTNKKEKQESPEAMPYVETASEFAYRIFDEYNNFYVKKSIDFVCEKEISPNFNSLNDLVDRSIKKRDDKTQRHSIRKIINLVLIRYFDGKGCKVLLRSGQLDHNMQNLLTIFKDVQTDLEKTRIISINAILEKINTTSEKTVEEMTEYQEISVEDLVNEKVQDDLDNEEADGQVYEKTHSLDLTPSSVFKFTYDIFQEFNQVYVLNGLAFNPKNQIKAEFNSYTRS